MLSKLVADPAITSANPTVYSESAWDLPSTGEPDVSVVAAAVGATGVEIRDNPILLALLGGFARAREGNLEHGRHRDSIGVVSAKNERVARLARLCVRVNSVTQTRSPESEWERHAQWGP